ncbi:MAG TPA: hypothetical protein PLA97_00660 [Rubrivivax sp.]|nr:hypothetical protein [Rubrivivax sp.]
MALLGAGGDYGHGWWRAQPRPVGGRYKVVVARSTVAPQITLDRCDFEFASAAFVPTARKGGGMSFLPLNRDDRQGDYPRFDVSGLQNARSQDAGASDTREIAVEIAP